jgi:hypothetical protein
VRLEAILLVCASLGLLAGCLVPNRWLPPLLTVLALRIAQDGLEAAWWMAGLLVFGWLIECLQALVPDRRFCWRDLAANAAGIGCAALAVFVAGHF